MATSDLVQEATAGLEPGSDLLVLGEGLEVPKSGLVTVVPVSKWSEPPLIG